MGIFGALSPGGLGLLWAPSGPHHPDQNPLGKTTPRINRPAGRAGKENIAQELREVGPEDTGAWIRKGPGGLDQQQAMGLWDHEQEQEQEKNQQHTLAPGCHHQGGFQPQEGDKTPPAPQQSDAGPCTEPCRSAWLCPGSVPASFQQGCSSSSSLRPRSPARFPSPVCGCPGRDSLHLPPIPALPTPQEQAGKCHHSHVTRSARATLPPPPCSPRDAPAQGMPGEAASLSTVIPGL